VLKRNAVALRWHLRMAGRDHGSSFAARLEQDLLASDHSDWLRRALAEP
jgi:hypothetical protein